MMSRKSRIRRPGHVPRWTMKPANSANTEQPIAAIMLYTNEFWSDAACAPRYSKCPRVKFKFVGK